jgi:hypothetical protein
METDPIPPPVRDPLPRRVYVAGGALVLGAAIVGAILLLVPRRTPTQPAEVAQAQAPGWKPPPPEILVTDKLRLTESQFRGWPLHFPGARLLALRVEAAPKPVNIALLQRARFDRFRTERDALLADKTRLVAGLSAEGTRKFSSHARVPAGDWVLVVEMPKASLLFSDDTTANVKLTSQLVAPPAAAAAPAR